MNIHIRPAVAGDAPTLVELLRQLGYPGAEDFIETRLRELAAHPDALLFVAEGELGVLGFISLHFIPQLALPRDFCRVSYLCVAEAARNLGVGAMLEDLVQRRPGATVRADGGHGMRREVVPTRIPQRVGRRVVQ